jgi:hypothetical protein
MISRKSHLSHRDVDPDAGEGAPVVVDLPKLVPFMCGRAGERRAVTFADATLDAALSLRRSVRGDDILWQKGWIRGYVKSE